MMQDFSTIVLCAVRYALGRDTYMPDIVQKYAKRNIAMLSDNFIECAIRDIQWQARLPDGLGSLDSVRKSWEGFLAFLMEEKGRRKEG